MPTRLVAVVPSPLAKPAPWVPAPSAAAATFPPRLRWRGFPPDYVFCYDAAPPRAGALPNPCATCAYPQSECKITNPFYIELLIGTTHKLALTCLAKNMQEFLLQANGELFDPFGMLSSQPSGPKREILDTKGYTDETPPASFDNKHGSWVEENMGLTLIEKQTTKLLQGLGSQTADYWYQKIATRLQPHLTDTDTTYRDYSYYGFLFDMLPVSHGAFKRNCVFGKEHKKPYPKWRAGALKKADSVLDYFSRVSNYCTHDTNSHCPSEIENIKELLCTEVWGVDDNYSITEHHYLTRFEFIHLCHLVFGVSNWLQLMPLNRGESYCRWYNKALEYALYYDFAENTTNEKGEAYKSDNHAVPQVKELISALTSNFNKMQAVTLQKQLPFVWLLERCFRDKHFQTWGINIHNMTDDKIHDLAYKTFDKMDNFPANNTFGITEVKAFLVSKDTDWLAGPVVPWEKTFLQPLFSKSWHTRKNNVEIAINYLQTLRSDGKETLKKYANQLRTEHWHPPQRTNQAQWKADLQAVMDVHVTSKEIEEQIETLDKEVDRVNELQNVKESDKTEKDHLQTLNEITKMEQEFEQEKAYREQFLQNNAPPDNDERRKELQQKRSKREALQRDEMKELEEKVKAQDQQLQRLQNNAQTMKNKEKQY